MAIKKIALSVIALAAAIYPIIIYVVQEHVGPSILALVFFMVMLVRFLIVRQKIQLEQVIQLVLVGGLCSVAAWLQSERLLRYYPVLMNVFFAGLFLLSLRAEKTIIERFAERFVKDINEHVKKYLRGLTKVWVFILVINSGISWYTSCCLPIKQWAFYNGVIAYLGFAVFTLFELVYRHFYKRRHGLLEKKSEIVNMINTSLPSKENFIKSLDAKTWPRIVSITENDQIQDVNSKQSTLIIQLEIAGCLQYFDGHFPEQAVLPGVVQVHWAGQIAKYFFSLGAFNELKKLKFNQMILPDSSVNLLINHNKENQTIKFEYSIDSKICSSGLMSFKGDYVKA